MTNRTLTFALAAMASLSAAPALASGGSEPRSIEVAYHDLDLATAKGIKELDRRINRAAREVCGLNATATGTRLPANESRACYRETKSRLDNHMAAVVAAHTRG